MTQDRYEEHVRALEAFGHRGSATDHERRAAEYLSGELRAMGIEPTLEEFRGARSLPARMLIHVLLAAIGSIFLWHAPLVTILLSVAALISFVVEQSRVVLLLSWPVCRHISRNVCGQIPSPRPPRLRILLCAHYDTQHSGWVWPINRPLMRLSFRSPLLLKPPMIPVLGLMLGGIVLGILQLSLGSRPPLTLLNLILLAAYALIALLFLQWAVGRSVPGAADNASGVAAVLEIADAWRQAPPADDVTLSLLFSGCEESGLLGAAAWANEHRPDLQSLPTRFVNIDAIGFGPPRFLGTEVPIAGIPLHCDAKTIQVCNEAAAELALQDAGPHAIPTTDGLAFLAHGIQGVTVVGFQDGGILPHYHTMADTSSNMDFTSAREGVEFARRVCWSLATLR